MAIRQVGEGRGYEGLPKILVKNRDHTKAVALRALLTTFTGKIAGYTIGAPEKNTSKKAAKVSGPILSAQKKTYRL